MNCFTSFYSVKCAKIKFLVSLKISCFIGSNKFIIGCLLIFIMISLFIVIAIKFKFCFTENFVLLKKDIQILRERAYYELSKTDC